MAHEKSITVPHGKKWVNLKTVFNGKNISEKDAVKMFRDGRIKPLGGKVFDTVGAAVSAAKRRSETALTR